MGRRASVLLAAWAIVALLQVPVALADERPVAPLHGIDAEPSLPHCVLTGDKTASPDTVELGTTATVTLTLRGTCANTQGALVFTRSPT